MIKEVDYQIKAVKELIEKTRLLLDIGGDRRKIVFEAPTGSGKTVMASKMLDELYPLLAEDGNAAAYIWIAPNKLHEQSYMRMKNYFTESHVLRPVMYDELDHTIGGYIKSGDVFFVNWESINKETNLMVKDTENSASLYDIVRRTKEEHGMKLIVIIDEAHRNTSPEAKKAEAVLKRLNANVEILISATPPDGAFDEKVTVYRKEVIKAEMIKDGITINPKLTDSDNALSENEYLLEKALAKREEIKASYTKVGARVNPLLLIQLPNDSKEKLDDDEKTIVDMVKLRLEMKRDITIDNGKLAVWLSGDKKNLESIEHNYSGVDVLLFKEAIALGWDCPRAAVLLIFRDIKSTTFGTQTVGRIMRMPEQKYYTEALLNHGWVYTNLEGSKIVIEQTDMGYLSMPLVAHRRENLVNVALPSTYMERLSADRNRLGPDFWQVLVEEFYIQWIKQPVQLELFEPISIEDENGSNGAVIDTTLNRKKAEQYGKIDFNMHEITAQILSDVHITGEEGVYNVSETHKRQYAKTPAEEEKLMTEFCAEMLSDFEKVSITTLRGYIYQLMEEVFGVSENVVPRLILYYKNKPHFKDVITRAIEKYRQKVKQRQNEAKRRAKKEYVWEVPEARDYNAENNTKVAEVEDHAMLPFIRLNKASTPEVRFEAFLEQYKQYIDWWYKNGDSGRQHYSIPYVDDNGDEDLFFVDFVIRMKSGKVFLFDTKSKDSDPTAVAKHNALIEYLTQQNAKGQNLQGGVLIEEKGIWKFCNGRIKNTTDLRTWTSFWPDANCSDQ